MKGITNFIKRNLPIFVIGLLTMLAFVAIILLSERNDSGEPALKIVNQDELVAEHNYYKGPEDAKVVLVEFSDFECPACALFAPTIRGFELKYPNLKIIYKHYPLPQHAQGKPAAIASMAAGEQDAFWEYHDKLFENQNQLNNDLYMQLAKDLGLDEERFKNDMSSDKIEQYVEADLRTGQSMGVNSTPTFFLNGKLLELKELTDLDKAITNEFNSLKQPIGSAEETAELEEAQEKLERRIALGDFDPALAGPTYEVRISEQGFTPYSAEMRVGQKLVWVNDTDKQITLTAGVGYEDVYPQLKSGIVIPAAGKGELDVFKPDVFVVVAKEIEKAGYIYPEEVDSELLETVQSTLSAE